MATHARVLERVGRIQDVYYQAIALIGQLSAKLSPEDAARLPDRIMTWRSKSAHGYLVDVANAATAHLSDEALRQWDIALAAMDHPTSERKTRNGPEREIGPIRDVRQAIARGLARRVTDLHPRLHAVWAYGNPQ